MGKGVADIGFGINAERHSIAGDGADAPNSLFQFAADQFSSESNKELGRTIADVLDIVCTAGLSEAAEERLAADAWSKLPDISRDFAGLHGVTPEALQPILGGFYHLVDKMAGGAAKSLTAIKLVQAIADAI